MFINVISSTIYGLGANYPQLVNIDPRTGFANPIGPSFPDELEGQQLSAIDAKNLIYYLIAFNETSQVNQVIGLDIKTGNVVTTIELPFSINTFIGVGESIEIDPDTGNIFVSGRDPAVNNDHHVMSINVKTKEFTSITTIGDIDVLGGASAYDPIRKIFLLTLGISNDIDIIGIDVVNKKVAFQASNPENLETMDYDPRTGKIYGIGLHVNSVSDYYRTLLTFDVVSQNFTIVGSIPGYFIIDSCISALNTDKRTLSTILQKKRRK